MGPQCAIEPHGPSRANGPSPASVVVDEPRQCVGPDEVVGTAHDLDDVRQSLRVADAAKLTGRCACRSNRGMTAGSPEVATCARFQGK